jgi:hypothetical protein
VNEAPFTQPPLPPPPLPPVWPKRLWILVVVTAIVAPILVTEFLWALHYEGPPVDAPSMTGAFAFLEGLALVGVWLGAAWTRVRRRLVRRGYVEWR